MESEEDSRLDHFYLNDIDSLSVSSLSEEDTEKTSEVSSLSDDLFQQDMSDTTSEIQTSESIQNSDIQTSEEIETPSKESSGIESSEIGTSESALITTPEMETPRIDSSKIEKLGFESSMIETPEIKDEAIKTPELESDEMKTPEKAEDYYDDESLTPDDMKCVHDQLCTATSGERQRELYLLRMLSPTQKDRYDSFKSGKISRLNVELVHEELFGYPIKRKVLFILCALGKIYAGQLIEQAKDIQDEEEFEGKITPEQLMKAQKRIAAQGMFKSYKVKPLLRKR